MSTASPPLDIFRPRPRDGWRTGLWLALAAHGLLLVALMLSVQWRSAEPEPVVAEMWSQIPVAQPTQAPAPPVPPEPKPEPIEPVAPPVPKPEPEPEPPPKPAEIQIKREPPPKPLPKPPKVEVKPEPAPKPVPKPVPKVAPPEPPVPAPRPRAEAKPTAPPVPTPPSKAVSKEALERERQANLQRMMDSLSQDQLSSAGSNVDHAGRIKARIKPNVVFTESVAGNPLAVVEVRCAPDGQIIGRKLTKASGVQGWDDAVLRAIDRTEVLPLDDKGKIPAVMQIEFRLKDF